MTRLVVFVPMFYRKKDNQPAERGTIHTPIVAIVGVLRSYDRTYNVRTIEVYSIILIVIGAVFGVDVQ